MTWRDRVAPRSAREVWALMMILLIIWFGVVLTLNGLADLPAASLGLAGTVVILGGGFARARRFRRR